MATAAQTAANRRNAQKSTGPKSLSGKNASSANARRHGLYTGLPVKDILAAYESITGRNASDLAQISRTALRLAMAEAQLARVREREKSLLARGDDYLRDLKLFDRIDDFLMEELDLSGGAATGSILELNSMKVHFQIRYATSTRRTYRSLLRALRAAENSHAAALHAWLSQP
jgi:hypothetical protein